MRNQEGLGICFPVCFEDHSCGRGSRAGQQVTGALGPFMLLCLFYRSGASTSCWARAHDLCFPPLKTRVRWPSLPCLLVTAKGRTAEDFSMGTLFSSHRLLYLMLENMYLKVEGKNMQKKKHSFSTPTS